MSRKFFLVFGVVVSFAILLLAWYFIAKKTINRVNPVYEGEISLKGIRSAAEIYFDDKGIPYITATDEADFAYIMGYLHAREKLFRMDILRRAGEGTMSEVYGSSTLDLDVFSKTIGFARVARKEYFESSQKTKTILARYSEGVNEYIKANKYDLPVEFDVLNYIPKDWAPEHSILLLKLLAWEMNPNRLDSLKISFLNEKGKKLSNLASVLEYYGMNLPEPKINKNRDFAIGDTLFFELNNKFLRYAGLSTSGITALNWASAPIKKGKNSPVFGQNISEDFYAPVRWYYVNASFGKNRISGLSIPGLPLILSGKNSNVTFLASFAGRQDAFFNIELTDSTAANFYIGKNKVLFAKYSEVIKVKDSLDSDVKLSLTQSGSVISDLLYSHEMSGAFTGGKKYVTINWDGFKSSDMFKNLWEISFATNPNEINTLKQQQTYLKFEYIVAGGDGVILNTGSSFKPVYQPPVEKKSKARVNQKKNEPQPVKIIAPAKYLISAENLRDTLNRSYSSRFPSFGFRDRLEQLLKADTMINLDHSLQYQTDRTAPAYKIISEEILEAFSEIKIENENLRTALEMLRKWDYNTDAYSQMPSIFSLFMIKFLQNTFSDELTKETEPFFYSLANFPEGIALNLIKDEENPFFDNVASKEYETKRSIIRKSFADALDLLEKDFGKVIANWQWGYLHKLKYRDVLGKELLPKNKLTSNQYGMGGSGAVIFKSGYSYQPDIKTLTDFFNVDYGTTYSFVFDQSEQNSIYLIISTGQSGILTSRHFSSFSENYFTGKYVKVYLNDEYKQLKNFTKLKIIHKE